MIQIVATGEHEWSITYYLEGVKCTEFLTKDRSIALAEISQKLTLEMGLAKGKTFTTISKH